MTTKKLCRIAIVAALEFVMFQSLSSILYIEAITLTIISVAVVFDIKEAALSSFIFGLMLNIFMGFTPWSIMYLIIYPLYSLFTSKLKKTLLQHPALFIGYGFLLSFLVGILLDIPFMLLDKNLTIIYILTSLKTSLIQGGLTALQFAFIFEPFYHILERIYHH